jgi:hypothetical protein
MNASLSAKSVRFDDDHIYLELSDGRVLTLARDRFPRLSRASAELLTDVRISSRGLHWEKLDEDISFSAFDEN